MLFPTLYLKKLSIMTNQIPRIVAIFILIVLYAFTVPFSLNDSEKRELAKDFKLTKSLFSYPSDLEPQKVRNLHPQYQEISTWISSVGASVAFADMDGDELYNDLVHVDPRFDKIFVFPAPNTGNRFESFELIPKVLPYNHATVVPSGILTNDFDEDGKEDILAFYYGRTPIIFYQRDNFTFEEQELSQEEKWNTASGTLADFNGDGHADILIGNYFPDESKIFDTQATDQDQVMQHSMSKGDNGGKNRIFLWAGSENGKAIFKEEKNWLDGLQFPNDWTLAVGAIDLNNDFLPEVYISNDFGPDKLLLNTSSDNKLSFKPLLGERHFKTVRSNVLGKDSFKGMGVEFGDINNDGLIDIYVSNIAADYALHESHFVFVNTGATDFAETGIAPFRNESEKYGLSRSSWGWDSRFCDLNNDGVQEALQATGFVKGEINRWPELQELATLNDELLSDVRFWPHLQPGDDLSGDAHFPVFVQHESGQYFDLSDVLGVGENQITRGIAVSDVQHDGRLDFAVANQWEPSKIYHNESNEQNTFLGIQLEYPLEANSLENIAIDEDIPSRPAISAVVRLKLSNGEERIDYVDGGNGHSGRNSKEVHFGLGDVSKQTPVEVEILWVSAEGEAVSSTINLTPGWHKVVLPY